MYLMRRIFKGRWGDVWKVINTPTYRIDGATLFSKMKNGGGKNVWNIYCSGLTVNYVQKERREGEIGSKR